ncbi:MAG: galactose-1-phosphate uridylyltransferase, partial [Clostridia bacterium]|nr:galactose-1-phosphate uridylyltransferase [Clostridia bacterium]
MSKLHQAIHRLVTLSEESGLAHPLDRAYHTNALLTLMGEDAMEAVEETETLSLSLEETLSLLCEAAYEKGLIPENSVSYRDLFDT